MSRYDKYDPVSGGFRAPLAADFVVGDINTVFGVGLDVNGRVVKGAGATGTVKGVLVLTKAMKAGDIVDVMTDGEIVEFPGAAGTDYSTLTTTGVVGTTALDATHSYVGFTVEASRLIVRVARGREVFA